MFTLTLSQGEGKEKRKRSHIHWHVNTQAGGICARRSVNLTDKLGTSLGHKTNIPTLGSKQRLNLQGQHESLGGAGGGKASPLTSAPEAGRRLAKPEASRRPPRGQALAALTPAPGPPLHLGHRASREGARVPFPHPRPAHPACSPRGPFHSWRPGIVISTGRK